MWRSEVLSKMEFRERWEQKRRRERRVAGEDSAEAPRKKAQARLMEEVSVAPRGDGMAAMSNGVAVRCRRQFIHSEESLRAESTSNE